MPWATSGRIKVRGSNYYTFGGMFQDVPESMWMLSAQFEDTSVAQTQSKLKWLKRTIASAPLTISDVIYELVL